MVAASWAAIRYRRVQALVVLVIAALVTATAVLAPLGSRALLQSVLAERLADLPPAERAVVLTSQDLPQPGRVVAPDALPGFVPPAVARHLSPAVAGLSLEVSASAADADPTNLSPVGLLLWQDGLCAGVRFTAGRCPAAQGEVAVTTAQAALSSWPVGTRLRLTEHTDAEAPDGPARTVVTVVGAYDQLDAPQWFGATLGGRAGTSTQDGGRAMDVLLADRATLDGPQPQPGRRAASWLGLLSSASLALAPGTGVDEVRDLGGPLATFAGAPAGETGLRVAAHTGLTDVVTDLGRDTEQVAVTVPLLVGQLGLVLAWLLWIVLSALAQQRRPEVALARLRGRGAGGARRLLLGETLPPVLAGVPLGAALAWGAAAPAGRAVLPGSPSPELRPPVLLALGAAAAGLLLLTLLATRRVVAEPVVTALRTVPLRAGAALGLLEAALVAVAALAYTGLLRGDLRGPAAMAAPALLALGAGVLLARAGGPAAARAGALLLARGRTAPGGALLQAGRRPTTRWVVPVVTVAAALPVVAVDVLAVAARNHDLRARAEVGAALAVETPDRDLPRLRRVLARLDPAGTTLTPVVLLRSASGGGPATQAVVPESFRRVAAVPAELPAAAWRGIALPPVAPWTVTGTRVSARVSGGPIGSQAPDARFEVGLRIVRADGGALTVPLAEVGRTGRPDGPVGADVPCRVGCRVVGVVASVPAGQIGTAGTFRLSGLAVDDRPVPLPGTDGWRTAPEPPDVTTTRGTTPDALAVSFVRAGAGDVRVLHASVEPVLPALVTAPVAPQVTPPGAVRLVTGTDGTTIGFRVAGVVRYAPGAPAATTVVNLDALTAAGGRIPGEARVLVLSARDDTAWRTRLVDGLRAGGVSVQQVTTTADVARGYARSAAGWSARLGAVVAVLAVLLAALALVVVAATGRRAVRRDYAGLLLAGMAPRTLSALAVWETVPLALVAGLAGLACGAVGADAVIGLVPLFPAPPEADVLDLSFATAPALGAGAAALAVVVAVCVAAARRTARPGPDGGPS